MKLVSELKQAAQLLLGIDAPLVGPGFKPYHPVLVEVGLVDALGYGQYDDEAVVFQRHVLGLHRQWAAHQLAGCIADELIDAGHILP